MLEDSRKCLRNQGAHWLNCLQAFEHHMYSLEQLTKAGKVRVSENEVAWKDQSPLFPHRCLLVLLRCSGFLFYNNSLHPHRYSNEDFIVIISCCYVPRCRRDMLCTDLLSAIELSSLMNLSGVNDSGWGNVVYKTGRGLVWVLCWCADTVGVNMSLG